MNWLSTVMILPLVSTRSAAGCCCRVHHRGGAGRCADQAEQQRFENQASHGNLPRRADAPIMR